MSDEDKTLDEMLNELEDDFDDLLDDRSDEEIFHDWMRDDLMSLHDRYPFTRGYWRDVMIDELEELVGDLRQMRNAEVIQNERGATLARAMNP